MLKAVSENRAPPLTACGVFAFCRGPLGLPLFPRLTAYGVFAPPNSRGLEFRSLLLTAFGVFASVNRRQCLFAVFPGSQPSACSRLPGRLEAREVRRTHYIGSLSERIQSLIISTTSSVKPVLGKKLV